MLKNNRISLASVGTEQAALKENLTFTNPEEKVREAAIDRTMRQMDFAAQFSAPVIVGLIGGELTRNSRKR